MKDMIKELGKWILLILGILILGIIILVFRVFVIDKDFSFKSYSESKNENNKSVANSEINEKNIEGNIIENSTIGNFKETDEKYHNDYDLNFDEFFLMYEGEQTEETVKIVLEHLISNSEEDFYNKTSVTSVNFGDNVTIKYDGDAEQYRNGIRELNNKVIEGLYDISFKYGGFGTYVNEIVITKK